ncbi:hypothetical protein SELMODRAFT_35138, partial [Selaginella moellendorffii]
EIERGREIHAQLHTSGYGGDRYLENLLVQMYGECGCVEDAHAAFEAIHERNSFSWNIMLAGSRQSQLKSDAVRLFASMDLAGIPPDEITLINVTEACSSFDPLDEGRTIHEHAVAISVAVHKLATALITLYGRCGHVADAWSVCTIAARENWNTYTWTAMMAALAAGGQHGEAVNLFQRMGQEGFQPDLVALGINFLACSHAGMIDQARNCFASIDRDYGITASPELFVSMLDVLGRSGGVQEARELIESIPVGGALLGSCGIHGARHLSRR